MYDNDKCPKDICCGRRLTVSATNKIRREIDSQFVQTLIFGNNNYDKKCTDAWNMKIKCFANAAYVVFIMQLSPLKGNVRENRGGTETC